MAKKAKKVAEIVEEVVEEGIDVKIVNTMRDKHGFTWEIDDTGNKLRRI